MDLSNITLQSTDPSVFFRPLFIFLNKNGQSVFIMKFRGNGTRETQEVFVRSILFLICRVLRNVPQISRESFIAQVSELLIILIFHFKQVLQTLRGAAASDSRIPDELQQQSGI